MLTVLLMRADAVVRRSRSASEFVKAVYMTNKHATKRATTKKAAKKQPVAKKRVVLKPAQESALSDLLKKYFLS